MSEESAAVLDREIITALEPRFLLANVQGTFRSDHLFLSSFQDNVNVYIERESSNDAASIRVRGMHGTTINGANIVTFPRALKGINVDFAGNNSSVTLSNLRVRSGLIVNLMGNGNTLLMRKLRVTGSLRLTGGRGIDRIFARDVIVQRDVYGSGGEDRDVISLRRFKVDGKLNWIDRSGGSSISLEQVRIGHDANIRLSNAEDRITILDSRFERSTDLLTFASPDLIRVVGTAFASNPTIIDGAGDDTVEHELFLRWDFAEGDQGWIGDFSDFGFKDRPNDGPPATFSAEKGITPIRDGGALDGTRGYRLAATNRSDDVFMYLTRRVGREAGVEALANYRAEFTIEFASEDASGLVGTGGAPAESVTMKAGGVGYQPVGFNDEITGRWVLNVKKSSQQGQTASDDDLTNVGDISNGSHNVYPDVFRRVVRSVSHANPITSSSDGNLWIIVGTDSGFEGRTTLYYLSITVRLTRLNSEDLRTRDVE